MIQVKDLFDLNYSMAKEYLAQFTYPWEAIGGIHDFILSLQKDLNKEDYIEIKENVYVHKTATVFDSAYINGPCIIGAHSEIRQCAFIRGNALVGEHCVVGNSCELKNVILFDYVQVPHFNYVGDSILGYHSHMGAGSITSNMKNDKKNIVIHNGEQVLETSLNKMGAILGDYVEVGCNSVLNPGTIVGKNTSIYPLTSIRGVVPENSIVKSPTGIIHKDKR